MRWEKEKTSFQVVCNNCSIKVSNKDFFVFFPYDPDFGNVVDMIVLPEGECWQGRQMQIGNIEVSEGAEVFVYPSDTSNDTSRSHVLAKGYYIFMLDEDTGEVTIES